MHSKYIQLCYGPIIMYEIYLTFIDIDSLSNTRLSYIW